MALIMLAISTKMKRKHEAILDLEAVRKQEKQNRDECAKKEREFEEERDKKKLALKLIETEMDNLKVEAHIMKLGLQKMGMEKESATKLLQEKEQEFKETADKEGLEMGRAVIEVKKLELQKLRQRQVECANKEQDLKQNIDAKQLEIKGKGIEMSNTEDEMENMTMSIENTVMQMQSASTLLQEEERKLKNYLSRLQKSKRSAAALETNGPLTKKVKKDSMQKQQLEIIPLPQKKGEPGKSEENLTMRVCFQTLKLEELRTVSKQQEEIMKPQEEISKLQEGFSKPCPGNPAPVCVYRIQAIQAPGRAIQAIRPLSVSIRLGSEGGCTPFDYLPKLAKNFARGVQLFYSFL